jgi:hypothetical protein
MQRGLLQAAPALSLAFTCMAWPRLPAWGATLWSRSRLAYPSRCAKAVSPLALSGNRREWLLANVSKASIFQALSG